MEYYHARRHIRSSYRNRRRRREYPRLVVAKEIEVQETRTWYYPTRGGIEL